MRRTISPIIRANFFFMIYFVGQLMWGFLMAVCLGSKVGAPENVFAFGTSPDPPPVRPITPVRVYTRYGRPLEFPSTHCGENLFGLLRSSSRVYTRLRGTKTLYGCPYIDRSGQECRKNYQG